MARINAITIWLLYIFRLLHFPRFVFSFLSNFFVHCAVMRVLLYHPQFLFIYFCLLSTLAMRFITMVTFKARVKAMTAWMDNIYNKRVIDIYIKCTLITLKSLVTAWQCVCMLAFVYMFGHCQIYFNDSLDFFCFHIVDLFPFSISRFFLPSFGSPLTVWYLYAFNQRTVTKYILFRSIFFTCVSFYKCVSFVFFFSLSLPSHS